MTAFVKDLTLKMSIITPNTINYILYLLAAIAIVFVLLYLFKRIYRYVNRKSAYFAHTVFLVRLPKEKPKDKSGLPFFE